MALKEIPCPICGRTHHIKGQKSTNCICGGTFTILRDQGRVTLIPTETIKTKPFKAKNI